MVSHPQILLTRLFKEYPGQLIIDEAQQASALFRELRGVIDADPMRKGRFLLTGSSTPDLHRNVSESLAGRVAMVEIGTFKMNERYELPLSPFYGILDKALCETTWILPRAPLCGGICPALNARQANR